MLSGYFYSSEIFFEKKFGIVGIPVYLSRMKSEKKVVIPAKVDPDVAKKAKKKVVKEKTTISAKINQLLTTYVTNEKAI